MPGLIAEAPERAKKGLDEKQAAKDHAKFFVPTTRTWSNSTFESGLSASRSLEERAAITQDMYQQYEDEVAANPQVGGLAARLCDGFDSSARDPSQKSEADGFLLGTCRTMLWTISTSTSASKRAKRIGRFGAGVWYVEGS